MKGKQKKEGEEKGKRNREGIIGIGRYRNKRVERRGKRLRVLGGKGRMIKREGEKTGRGKGEGKNVRYARGDIEVNELGK